MNRPRLFLSAVTAELLGARTVVASTVRTLGFDAVSQEDFPTGHGELRQWLREQIDACDGLIQLVGHAYGAEPPTIELNDGRVSYTQFEFLYARQRNKKTWVIVIGDDYPRNHALAQIDRPPDSLHPDPDGYQAERRSLQGSYVARLTADNHLRHAANSPAELQNIVLRLKDALGELRQQSERQRRQLARAFAVILVGLGLLIAGGWWGYQRIQRAVEQTAALDTERLRAHLLATVEDTHRRELTEADRAGDWKDRQRLREAADAIHAVRLTRISELAASFAEIEGGGTTTDVFRELTRILTEQGVDEAIAYMTAQRPAILQTVRTRAAVARERNRADLSPLLQMAALHEAKGQILEARSLYSDVLSAEPNWPEALRAAFWFHVNQGDSALLYSSGIHSATSDYEEADRLVRRLATGDPTNVEWQRCLAISYSKRGDLAVVRGQLAEAAGAYTDTVAIAERLAADDPGNSQRQHDVSVAYERLGDVAVPRGLLAEAARAYADGLAIAKTLAASDPGNTQKQRALSISYNKQGDVAMKRGQLAEAARAYTDAQAIRKTLAATDPGNPQWQRDLGVSYEKLGNVALAEGRLADAARAYSDGLAISRTLATSDPDNTQWQRDLAVSHSKLGDVAKRQGELAVAARAYSDALAITRTLAARDPTNTERQHDLAIAYGMRGTIAMAQDQLEGAERDFTEALAIRRTLAAGDPGNAEWQRDLAASYHNLGTVAGRLRKTVEAGAYLEDALHVLSTIEARGLHLSPEDRQWLLSLRERVASLRQ